MRPNRCPEDGRSAPAETATSRAAARSAAASIPTSTPPRGRTESTRSAKASPERKFSPLDSHQIERRKCENLGGVDQIVDPAGLVRLMCEFELPGALRKPVRP